MAIVAIIFDHAPEYLKRCAEGPSLLGLPLGTGTVLEAFVEQAMSAGADHVFVMPTFDVDGLYKDRITELSQERVAVWPVGRQQELIDKYEAGDVILALDGRYWSPEAPAMSEVIKSCCDHRTAVHVISPGGQNGTPPERILFDEAGRIKRIRRLYEKITWLHGCRTVVPCAAMAQQLAETGPVYPISESRLRMLGQGVPSHDRVLPGQVLDLCDPWDVLVWNRLAVARAVEAIPTPAGYSRNGGRLLLAEGCELAGSARIIGPVIVKSGATIEPEVTVVGPCVIGRRARVERGALVVRSILPDDCTVGPKDSVIRAVGLHNGRRGTGRTPQESSVRTTGPRQPDHKLRADWQGEDRRLPALQASGSYLAVKRAIDFVGALIGLLLLLPVLPFIILLLKIDSPGSIFFRHRREGLGGREFSCVKFRTMRSGAHNEQRDLYAHNEADGPQFQMSRDPRVTRIGNWLRKLNIDELPQLVNVLLGHMSLVGPRPSPFRENQICLPWREARLAVRPGITGLWQICRQDRSESDFNQWIYYDVAYVRHMSLLLDIKIMVRTVTSLGGWRTVRLERLLPSQKERHPYFMDPARGDAA